MAILSKQALVVENNSSFPDNSTGAITAYGLRNYNTDIIDSMVDELTFVPFTASVNVSISNLNQFTASQQPTFVSLNAFTASQLTINTGINSFTQSATGRLNNLESTTSSLNAWSQSINEIIVNGTSIGTSTRFYFNGFVSASIVPNVNGAIASITILSDPSLATTASFNQFTSSINTWSASAKISIAALNSQTASILTSIGALNSYTASDNTSISNLNNWSASAITSINALNAFSASDNSSQAALNSFTASIAGTNAWTASAKIELTNLETTSASLNISVNNLNSFTSSQSSSNTSILTSLTNLNSYTASTNTKFTTLGNLTGSYATTGSNTFVGTQTINAPTIMSSSITITGSAYGSIISSSIASSTASIDLSQANYFTLTLTGTTNINVINPKPGVTATLLINTGLSGSATFSSNVKQPSGSLYVASPSGNIDIISLTAFSTSSVYVVPAYTFV
jgi:hypothetical protein